MPPRVFKEDGEGAKARPPTAVERENIIEKKVKAAKRKHDFVDKWQQPAPAAGDSSAASDTSWDIIESDENSPRFSNVTDDTKGEQILEKVLPSSRSGYSGDAPPVNASPASSSGGAVPPPADDLTCSKGKAKSKAKAKQWPKNEMPPKSAKALPYAHSSSMTYL